MPHHAVEGPGAQWRQAHRTARNALVAWALLLGATVLLARPLAPWLPGPEFVRQVPARVMRLEQAASGDVAFVTGLDRQRGAAVGHRWQLSDDHDVEPGFEVVLGVDADGRYHHDTSVPGGPTVFFVVGYVGLLVLYGMWRLAKLHLARRDLERPGQRLGKVWVAIVRNPVHRSVHEAVVVWHDDPTRGQTLPRPDDCRLADLSEDEHAEGVAAPTLHEAWTPVREDGTPTRGRWFATADNLVLTVRRPSRFTRWVVRRGLGTAGGTTTTQGPPAPVGAIDRRVGFGGLPRAVALRALVVVALGALGWLVGQEGQPAIPSDVLLQAGPIRQVTLPHEGLEPTDPERALTVLPLARIASQDQPAEPLLEALDLRGVRYAIGTDHQIVRFDTASAADAGALVGYLALAHTGELADEGGRVVKGNFAFEVMTDARPERAWWVIASQEREAERLVAELEPVPLGERLVATPNSSVTVRARTKR